MKKRLSRLLPRSHTHPAAGFRIAHPPWFYEALPPGHIRLLRPLRRDDEICFTVRQFKMQFSPKYAALSYCWGSAEEPKHVKVDRYQVPATANLLCALRDLLKYHDIDFLWVDALCINQDDLAERTHKVEAMGAIFERADVVYAYMGPEQSFTASCFLRLGGESPEADDDDLAVKLRSSKSQSEDPGPNALLDADYWHRTWIAQGQCGRIRGLTAS